MIAKGTIQITDDLIMTDPVMTIKNITYNWETTDLIVECYFKEVVGGAFFNSRSFTFPNTGKESITKKDIQYYFSIHPILSLFHEQE